MSVASTTINNQNSFSPSCVFCLRSFPEILRLPSCKHLICVTCSKDRIPNDTDLPIVVCNKCRLLNFIVSKLENFHNKPTVLPEPIIVNPTSTDESLNRDISIIHLPIASGDEIFFKRLREKCDKHGYSAEQRQKIVDQFVNPATPTNYRSNLSGYNVFHCAIVIGSLPLVKVLVELFDPDLRSRTRDGKELTGLHIAAVGKNIEIVKYLCSVEPRLSRETDHHGDTPLHRAAFKGKADVIQFFLDGEMRDWNDLEAVNKHQMTPLMKAAFANRKDIVQLLINKYGAKSGFASSTT